MSKILEEIQTRLTEAQKRLAEANQGLAVAQQAQQAAQHNFNVWSAAMQIEQRDEQLRQAAATEKQLPLPTAKPQSPILASDASDSSASDSSDSGSKTDAVRTILRQHPAGMTATEIWKEVSGQFKHRPYLYSVLKRLKDRNEVIKRRTKYCLKLAPEVQEVREQPVVH
jgi:hypothetical protein